MAFQKFTGTGVPKYFLINPFNNLLEVKVRSAGSPLAASGGQVVISFAGTTSDIVLSQQNAADLITILTPFALSGTFQ